jgi:hypothetical protein
MLHTISGVRTQVLCLNLDSVVDIGRSISSTVIHETIEKFISRYFVLHTNGCVASHHVFFRLMTVECNMAGDCCVRLIVLLI